MSRFFQTLRLVLNVAFNYGGRDEIIQAIGMPAETRIRASWLTSLGGNDELDRRHLFSLDVNGEGIYAEPLLEVSTVNLTAAISGRIAYIKGIM